MEKVTRADLIRMRQQRTTNYRTYAQDYILTHLVKDVKEAALKGAMSYTIIPYYTYFTKEELVQRLRSLFVDVPIHESGDWIILQWSE